MNNHIFEQVFWFLDEFGVEADVFSFDVAATPFCFHALEVVVGDFDAELFLPLFNQERNSLVKKRFVPGVEESGAFEDVGFLGNVEGDAFVALGDVREWRRCVQQIEDSDGPKRSDSLGG